MKKNILSILLLLISMICSAQTTSIKYFKDEWCTKEVSEQKANYSKTITEKSDGTTTKETKNIKSGLVITSSTYKGDEPFGIWVYQSGNQTRTMNYDFKLNYSSQKCDDSISNLKISDYFQNVDSIGYKAPTGVASIGQFLASNIVYPVRAKDEGIQGKVELMFTITKEGNVDNIVIVHGTNVLLDKEAVRVIRKLKFSSPATLNGQAQTICVTQMVRFVLQ